MGVCTQVVTEIVVALQARLVGLHAGCELVVVVEVAVHRVAGETGHFTVLITGGIEQAIILAAGDAYHAVRPETVFQPPVAGVWVTVLGNECLGFALLSWFGASKCAGLHDSCIGFKCIPGQKTGSIFEPIDFVGGVLVGVALAADLRRQLVVKSLFTRIEDRMNRLVGEVC